MSLDAPPLASLPLDTLLDEARDQLDDAVRLRRAIHRRPELGLELLVTQAAILAEIEGLGLDVRTGTSTTSVVATLVGGRPGGTVLLRADMDALPMPEDTGLDFASEVDGAMHACGHDAHVAMLVGAARLLASRRAELTGTVVFAFQPGEEGFGGARFMLDEGLVDDVPPDRAYAIHITPSIPSGLVACKGGSMMASSDTITIEVTGRGGHASRPHESVDPIPVACEIVTALQAFVTRQVDAFDPAVVTIARIEAGTTSNVIPETARLTGTIRTVSEWTRALVHSGVRRLAEGIAGAHGAEATVTLDDGYPVTVNNAGAAAFVGQVANGLLGAGRYLEMPTPVMGAEDFSYVLQRVPGAMAFLGASPGGSGPVAPNHSNRMVLDEEAMVTGMALHTAVALHTLAAPRD